MAGWPLLCAAVGSWAAFQPSDSWLSRNVGASAPFAGLGCGLELLLSSPCVPLPDPCRLLSVQAESSFSVNGSPSLLDLVPRLLPPRSALLSQEFCSLAVYTPAAGPALLSVHSAQSPRHPTLGEGPGATMLPDPVT